jgi:hypothetical protein
MANYEKTTPALVATDDDADTNISFYYRDVLVTPATEEEPAVYDAVPHVRVADDEYPLSHVGYTAGEKAQLKALLVKAIQYRLADQGYSEV